MNAYQHTQSGGTIIGGLLITGLVFAVISVFIHALIAGTLVLAIVAWFFRSLTVEVTDTALVWYFGSGFPRKSVSLSQVVSAEPVRTSFLNGWGIHYTPRGWLYNVSGFDAVCVTLRNGKRFCVGTDEPEELARQLLKKA